MPATLRRGREGSRWINERPDAREVAEWFNTVPLHDGMEHTAYIGGVTLIPAQEKSNEVVDIDDNNAPILVERHDLTYTPYVKVETRVAYFWQLMALRGWVGQIDTVVPDQAETLGLPPGFFRYTAADPRGQGKQVTFVGCSKVVRVYERSRTTGELLEVMMPPPGTKTVPTATKWDVDVNAMEKAETGAVGRSLGFAGMLVVPGSGVATVEDMLDQAAPGISALAGPELPAATPVEESDETLRAYARELVGRLTPAKAAEFQEWAGERRFDLTAAEGPVLRGAVKKLEKLTDGA